MVLEKGSEPGAHILSGAVMDPRAMNELFPNWKELGAPLNQPVSGDDVLFLKPDSAARVPDALVPGCLHNQGNYVISLSDVCKWLAQQAEGLGVEIFPGFAAAEVLYADNGAVRGVATGNMGIGKDGEPNDSFQLGMELLGKYTLFAEGARGHLGKQLIAKYQLDAGRDPQSYAIGIKELWEIDPAKAKPGLVVHTAGWPMDSQTYGGGFLYHLEGNKATLGLVVGLDYSNPWLSPFEEMQRWKTHRSIRAHLEGGKRIGYGARAICAGGILSLPKTVFPGRRADRLRCRLPEFGAHQGQPRGAEERHALRRGGLCRAAGGTRARRAERLPRSLQGQLAVRGTRGLAQLQAVVQEGGADRRADDRHRTMAAAQAGLQVRRRGRSTAPSPTTWRCAPRPNARRSTTPSPTASSPSTGSPACSSATPTTRSSSRRT